MVILGLGSNIGDRLTHLRNALRAIKNIPRLRVQEVSPIYSSLALLLPNQTSTAYYPPYLNLAIRCETDLAPYELLAETKKIEQKTGRKTDIDWAPRILDIDILAWDDLIQYDGTLHIPHEHLHTRPFALWPLADVAPHWIYPIPGPLKGKSAKDIASIWGSRFSGDAPLHTKQIEQRIDTPSLVGIINLTPDSFSNDGHAKEDSATLQHIKELVDSGAEIIDIGAEATGPSATVIDADIEWERLQNVLKGVMACRSEWVIPPKISVDTRNASVAKKALLLGVDWINDVSGLTDPAMCRVLAEHPSDIVFMHHLTIPASLSQTIPPDEDPVSTVYQWALDRLSHLKDYSISPERLILDIGIGFGKTAQQSTVLLKNIASFKNLGLRLLIGHSRKSFLQQWTPAPVNQRDIETTMISLYLAKQEIDFLRVHSVNQHARAFKMMQAWHIPLASY